jgi:hypothetical protein
MEQNRCRLLSVGNVFRIGESSKPKISLSQVKLGK